MIDFNNSCWRKSPEAAFMELHDRLAFIGWSYCFFFLKGFAFIFPFLLMKSIAIEAKRLRDESLVLLKRWDA